MYHLTFFYSWRILYSAKSSTSSVSYAFDLIFFLVRTFSLISWINFLKRYVYYIHNFLESIMKNFFVLLRYLFIFFRFLFLLLLKLLNFFSFLFLFRLFLLFFSILLIILPLWLWLFFLGHYQINVDFIFDLLLYSLFHTPTFKIFPKLFYFLDVFFSMTIILF